MTRTISILFASAFALIFLGILSPLFMSWLKPGVPLPNIAQAPSFVLTDSSGKDFSSTALKGKVWVANFFFTSCQGPCPIQNAALAAMAAKYKTTRDVEFVSISVDPETDTPEKLAEYAAKFNANTSLWHFLAGSKATVSELLNTGFKLGSVEEPKFHSTRFILVDREGMIRGYYQGTDDESVARLKTDLPNLLH